MKNKSQKKKLHVDVTMCDGREIENKEIKMKVNDWRTSRTLPCTMFLRSRTSTLLFPLRYALCADPWLVVQTLLASSGQSEINVDDSNHAV